MDISRFFLGMFVTEFLRDFPDFSDECQRMCATAFKDRKKNNEPFDWHGEMIPITCTEADIDHTVSLIFRACRGARQWP